MRSSRALPKRAQRAGALLSGDVARRSDVSRDAGVEEYAARQGVELAAYWLSGWDEANRRIREGLPSRYAPPTMIQER